MKVAARSHARSRGASSLEFAVVLPVFLLLLYGLVLYALLFAAQHTLVQAAAEGARAALRHGSVAERELAACQAANDAMRWLAQAAPAATSCSVSTECDTAPCRRVRVRYDYLARPLVPPPPLLTGLVPARLQSDAVVHFHP